MDWLVWETRADHVLCCGGAGLQRPEKGGADGLPVAAWRPQAEPRCHRLVAAKPIGDGAVEAARIGFHELPLRRIAVKRQALDEIGDGCGGRLQLPARAQE